MLRALAACFGPCAGGVRRFSVGGSPIPQRPGGAVAAASVPGVGTAVGAGVVAPRSPGGQRAASGGAAAGGGLSVEWGFGFDPSGPEVPVTLLAGFLGAGKTTLLRQLLENRTGLQVGVLVNDVAAVNVDAQIVASLVAGADGVQVAQLQNGCVCCSISDDLFASMGALMDRAPPSGFDHLIIELSGVSEPAAVKLNWVTALEVHHPAALRSKVRSVVTVVDAGMFGSDWLDATSAIGRNKLEGLVSEASAKPVVELLFEQVEAADVVLLNKADLASAGELETARVLVSSLNPRANVIVSEYGQVDPASLLPRHQTETHSQVVRPGAAHTEAVCDGHTHGHESACDGHGHGHADVNGHGHGHGHAHGGGGHGHGSPAQSYGIWSFVYRERRPFNAGRFDALASEFCITQRAALKGQGASSSTALSGLLRAKGTCWIDSSPLHEHRWHFGGANAALSRCDPWWAACSPQHRHWRAAYPGNREIFERVMAEAWDNEGPWGDRRQELVFIGGPGMSEDDLRAKLDACLLSSAEMEAFAAAQEGKEAPFEMTIGGVKMSLG